ncbi:F-box only protein 22 [Cephus cinctus]|uniref:F-box only protein 22 n=1 Tax=Cephus cinctus TaxID=211228 RepID=A0AAJ7BQ86_CEPCN|nr:F-box only protein 22 [Cephus cinctus]XP_015591653.1 F-box only protein 22 [Cephus cinctus]XP_015591654.1 F-box only protein 22 [Cephus cinctus]
MENTSKRTAKKDIRKVAKRSQKQKSKRTNEDSITSDSERWMSYDVLRIIFRHLNGKDLTSAAMVCRLWQGAASDEKKTRLWPDCFMVHISKLEEKGKTLGLSIVKHINIQPIVGLVFGVSTINSRIVCESRIMSKKGPGCYCSYLPTQCKSIIFGDHGMIANQIEAECDNDAVSCLFLPKVPNVKIKTFTLTSHAVSHNFKQFAKNRKRPFSQQFDKDMKAVIIFSNDAGSGIISRMLQFFVSERSKTSKEPLSVWGGIATELAICNRKDNKCLVNVSLAGISFSGSDISTWSIVIDDQQRTKEQIEAKLSQLKDCIKLRKYTIGFMLACYQRGVRLHSERNVESSIFKKLFPNIPLVGTFGSGEFGLTTINNDSSQLVTHEWSTIFMILSYG